MFKLKYICFCFITSTVFVSNGQDFNFDVQVELKPYYNDIHGFDAENTVGIKEKIWLKSDLTNGKRTDTLAIYTYNSAGNEIAKIGFKGNKRNSLTRTQWNGDLKILIEHIMPDFSSSIVNSYDERKNLLQTLDVTIRKSDTTMFHCTQFSYDSDNNLVEKLVYAAESHVNLFNQYVQRALFEYDKEGNLKKHMHFSGENPTQPTSLYYYTDQLLDSVVRVYHTNSTDKKYDYNHFKYNQDRKLIYKSEPIAGELNYEPDGIIIEEYYYDSEGLLKQACATRKKEIIVEVNYHYKNALIHEVIAKNSNSEFVSSIYYFHSNRVNEIKDVYIRNENNHVLSEERYFDGQLAEIYTSIYTYY